MTSNLFSLLFVICCVAVFAYGLVPKAYYVFDVPNDGPVVIHTIDASNGEIVASLSVPQFDAVNISASNVFYHEIEQNFYLWQESPASDSFDQEYVSNNIMIYRIVAKTAEVDKSVQVVDAVLGKNYKAVNYDRKSDKFVAFGDCIYQRHANITNNQTQSADSPQREYRSCFIAVDYRSGNISQYWIADKHYTKISPYAGAADLSNNAALMVYRTDKGQSVCKFSLGPDTQELHIPKTYFNGSYATGCLNTKYQEFFFSFNAMPNQQSIYAMFYNVSASNITNRLVSLSETAHLSTSTLIKFPPELRSPFQDQKSIPFVSFLSYINSEIYQLWFNTSLAKDEEGSLIKYDFVILSNPINQKGFKANLTIAGSADKISYAFAIGVAYDAGISTAALAVIVVCVVSGAGGATFAVVMCMRKRSADDFEML